MEQEEQGVSFGKVLKVAFKNWIRFAIVGTVVAIAGSCALIFGYNSLSGEYVSEFAYFAKDLSEVKYADGSTFFYSQIISSDNLHAVKNSSEDFASVKVDKMIEDGGISIMQTITTSGDSKTRSYTSYSYTLNVGKTYFSNSTQAKNFVKLVTSIPLEQDKNLIAIDNFSDNLMAFDAADTYEDQLSYLEGQANSLDKQYSVMLANESLSASALGVVQANIIQIDSIVGEKETISEKDAITGEVVVSTGKRSIVNQLRYELNQEGYVMDYNSDLAKSFEYSVQALEAEKALNTQKISALITEINKIDNNVTVSTIDAQISELTQRNIDIQYEIDRINLMISNKDKDVGGASEDATYIAKKSNFANRLKAYRTSLSSCTESYVNLLKLVYIDNASVSYNGSIINTKGTISVAGAIIVSVLAGVIVAGATNLIVDRKKLYE